MSPWTLFGSISMPSARIWSMKTYRSCWIRSLIRSIIMGISTSRCPSLIGRMKDQWGKICRKEFSGLTVWIAWIVRMLCSRSLQGSCFWLGWTSWWWSTREEEHQPSRDCQTHLRTSSERSGPTMQMLSAFFTRALQPWRLISPQLAREPPKEHSMMVISESSDTSLATSSIPATKTWSTSVWARSSQRRTRPKWSDTQCATHSTCYSSSYFLCYLGNHLLLLAWVSHRLFPSWSRSNDPLEIAVRSVGLRSVAVPGEDAEGCCGEEANQSWGSSMICVPITNYCNHKSIHKFCHGVINIFRR